MILLGFGKGFFCCYAMADLGIKAVMDLTNLIWELAFITNIRGTQLFIIVLVILLLFGTKRLPEIAKGFGKALREFRKSASEAEEGFRESLGDERAGTKSTSATKTEEPAQTAAVEATKQ